MIYFIERFRPDDIPFHGSDRAVNINGKIYDILKAPRSPDLVSISDYIISEDTKTFEKSNSRYTKQIEEIMLKEYNLSMNTLLLG